MSTTRYSDGTIADVQQKINDSVNGDIVDIPAGPHNWGATSITCNKAITIRGQGAGRVVAYSDSPNTIGLGSKTFAIELNRNQTVTVGQILRVYKTGGEFPFGSQWPTGNIPWMEGEVTAASPTSVTINVTSTNHTGSYTVWIFCTKGVTNVTITSGTVSALNVTESTAGVMRITGIQFERTVAGDGTTIKINSGGVYSGRPVRIDNCFFGTSNGTDIDTSSVTRGLIHSCSFVRYVFSWAPLNLHCKSGYRTPSAWTEPSYWGALDTTGEYNMYIEDCDFHAGVNATDFDDNSRAVVRYCTFNYSAIGTHGADTGSPAIGLRYFEVYQCQFRFKDHGNGIAMPNTWFFYVRGGSFIVTQCELQYMDSQDYNPATFNMTIQNLRRSAGSFACWGASTPGVQWPAPRQVGRGNPDGSATTLDPLSLTIMGESEPAYIWNNTGTYTITRSNYTNECGADADSVVDYIQPGRDYYDNGTAKPGYVPYTYPHPLRDGTLPPSQGTPNTFSPRKLRGKRLRDSLLP
jgi:hypothetical protein